MTSTAGQVTCAASSLAGGEALAGTATVASDWLLVEARGAWGRDAVVDSGLERRRPGCARRILRQGAARSPARAAWSGHRHPRPLGGIGRLGDPTGDRLARGPSSHRSRVGRRRRGADRSRLRPRTPRRVLRPARPAALRGAERAALADPSLAVLAPRRPPLRAERRRAPVRDPARTDPRSNARPTSSAS